MKRDPTKRGNKTLKSELNYLETTMVSKYFCPWDTALTIADLSAHMANEYEAFSTFVPEIS